MTQLRKMMLEELQRRNYAQSTVDAYVRALWDFTKHFKRPPDQLGPEHIRQFQLHMLRDQKLATNTVKQRMAAIQFSSPALSSAPTSGTISRIRKARSGCPSF